MAELKELADQLVNLTVKEVNELADILKEEYGIEPSAAPVVAAGGPAAGGEGESAEEEQTEFDVVLKSAGNSKLQVVKLVKEIAGQGLKESKQLVDSAPETIKSGTTKEDAESLKSQLEDAGAEIEIQ